MSQFDSSHIGSNLDFGAMIIDCFAKDDNRGDS